MANPSEPGIAWHQAAAEKLIEATRWYRSRDERVAGAFADAIEHAITAIAQAPDRWAPHNHGTRRYLLRQFPYGIVYRSAEAYVEIVAVAHTKRKPDYWKQR